MDIITGIAAAKGAIEIANELRSIDKEIDKADLKLRIVALIDSILDTKEALQDAKEREFTLKEEIRSLKETLEDRRRFEDEGGFLYEIADDGSRIGEPYCNQCYVKEDRKFRLVSYEKFIGLGSKQQGRKCNNCKTEILMTTSHEHVNSLSDLGKDLL